MKPTAFFAFFMIILLSTYCQAQETILSDKRLYGSGYVIDHYRDRIYYMDHTTALNYVDLKTGANNISDYKYMPAFGNTLPLVVYHDSNATFIKNLNDGTIKKVLIGFGDSITVDAGSQSFLSPNDSSILFFRADTCGAFNINDSSIYPLSKTFIDYRWYDDFTLLYKKVPSRKEIIRRYLKTGQEDTVLVLPEEILVYNYNRKYKLLTWTEVINNTDFVKGRFLDTGKDTLIVDISRDYPPCFFMGNIDWPVWNKEESEMLYILTQISSVDAILSFNIDSSKAKQYTPCQIQGHRTGEQWLNNKEIIYKNNSLGERLCKYNLYTTGIEEDITEPVQYKLGAYPNPFNSTVHIKIPSGLKINKVFIYDIRGQLIKTIINDKNLTELTWDGTNEFHSSVTSGAYFVVIVPEELYKGVTALKVLYLK